MVGTGLIGASWAALFLAQGLEVFATDPSPEAEKFLFQHINNAWPALTQLGLAQNASRDRLHFSRTLESSLEGADFVQESGPERLETKVQLLGEIDIVLHRDVIIASSSSGLMMTEIQSACRHPERCVIGHPFNPPHLIPVVEVVGGSRTSIDSIVRAMEFYESVNKRPIHVLKEVHGHVANRLQAALWREAVYLVEQGVISVGDLDSLVCWGPGLRWGLMGPNLLFHLGGGKGGIQHFMDHLAHSFENWWSDLGAPILTPRLKQAIVEGVLKEAGSRTVEELAQQRDSALLELLNIRSREAN